MITKADMKFIVSLQIKKQRQKYGQFIVEGEKSIAELLKSSYKIDKLYATSAWLKANSKHIDQSNIFEISDKELLSVSVHQAPQRALAIVKIPETTLSLSDFQHPLSLALDNLQDPGNMGAIIRIADWYGIKTIICSKGCTDVYNPKCINSTMGSFTRVNVFYDDIITVAEKFRQPIIAAVLNGDNIHSVKAKYTGLIVIGNEGHGIDNEILKKATHQVTIPRFGGAESLNAAVSTAILVDNLIK